MSFVYVVYGVYSDRSASKILGIYTSQAEAEDRVKIIKSADSIYNINFAELPLGESCGVMLEP